MQFIVIIILSSVLLFISACEAYVLMRFRIAALQKKPQVIALHIAAVFVLVCLLYAHYVAPYDLEVTHVDIATAKFKSAHVRIVAISDMHCDTRIGNEPKLIKIINGLDADLIVFTGDALNSTHAVPLLRNTLSALHSNLGKFAITGNYDLDFEPYLERFKGTGFDFLDSNTVHLTKGEDSFYLTGITFSKLSDWPTAARMIPREGYSIFLCHYPDIIDDAFRYNIDLYLAGHTHGGQIALPLVGGIMPYYTIYNKRYESGFFTINGVSLYVNRGIGMAGRFPRLRFMARPEITVFDIHPTTERAPTSQGEIAR